jgi:hypothetical protein
MSVSRSGDGWTVEVDGTVMVWEFLPGMELTSFKQNAYPVFEDLLDTHEITGMVTVVRLDDPFNEEVFSVWEQTAKRVAEDGMDRWAVVADGITAISLRGKVDTGEVKTLTTEDRAEAVDWVHGSRR